MKILENEDLGKLILRITVASLMLFHGYEKIIHGIGSVEGALVNAGLPAFISYGSYIGEVIAPVLLILGLKVRFSALMIIFTMLTAVVLTHANDIFSITQYGAWVIEIQMFYMLSSLAIIFLGSGKYTINNIK